MRKTEEMHQKPSLRGQLNSDGRTGSVCTQYGSSEVSGDAACEHILVTNPLNIAQEPLSPLAASYNDHGANRFEAGIIERNQT